MAQPVDLVLVLVLLANFLILGTGWMRVCIRAAAFQGVLLSLLPLLSPGEMVWRVIVMAAGAAIVKGILIPSLLVKAMRDVHIRHEVEPYVGFIPSLFLCALGTGFAILFSGRLPLAAEHVGTLLVPAALSTLLSGFLVLITRKFAITQVVGYLVLENGIFVFGLLLIEAMPFMVEVGVLLDLFVGIFIMGIVLNHIQREFSAPEIELLADEEE
ncbi:MAG: hydrogenase [Acidobacteria bacterium]|nr:hydrogenase [Acidobacteriota bacterium]